MKILFIFSSIFFCNHIFSQEKIDLFSKFITQSIGINQITKDSIYAKEVYFEYFIKDHGYDSINNIIHAKLDIQSDDEFSSKKGIITAIDLDSNKLIWSNKYNLNKTNYKFLENNIYFKQKDEYYKINSITQENQIPLKSFIYIDTSFDKDFGICFSKDENFSNVMKLTAINTKTNETIWESELQYQKEFFIADPVRYGEQFYFINTQLNSINLKTGKTSFFGNDFYYKIDKTNYYLPMGLLESLLYSALTNIFSNPEYAKQSSNILFLDSFYYIANYKSIFQFNYKNELINEIRHYNNKALTSSLIKFDSFIYIINSGYTYIDNLINTPSMYSSFLSKYNINLKFIEIYALDDQSIFDFKLIGDTVFLIENYTSRKINLRNNKFENFTYKNKDFIPLKHIYNSDKLYYNENNIFNLLDINSSSRFYFKEKKEDSISEFDLNMKLLKKYSIFRISESLYKNEKLKFIQNKGECFILNNENKLILELPNIEKLIYRNKKYYISLDNQIMIIDENQLVK